jgi:hypothetical protein
MTEDEIAEMRARDAFLDYLKRSHPHGLRLILYSASGRIIWYWPCFDP